MLFLTYQQLRMFYLRSLKSFQKEIDEYLLSKNFKLVDQRKPKGSDWKDSPFQKPPAFQFGPAILLNGSPIIWSDSKYLLLKVKDKEEVRNIWLRIDTTYFQEPKLKFIADTK